MPRSKKTKLKNLPPEILLQIFAQAYEMTNYPHKYAFGGTHYLNNARKKTMLPLLGQPYKIAHYSVPATHNNAVESMRQNKPKLNRTYPATRSATQTRRSYNRKVTG